MYERFVPPPGESGEHLLLHLAHEGLGTAEVLRRLARGFAVPPSAVGYCGRKDRVARVRQWFSVTLPGRAPALAGDPGGLRARLGPDGLDVLEARCAARKLRVGTHAGNRFEIVVRGEPASEARIRDHLETRVPRLCAGVPNYFGPQRFEHPGWRARIDEDCPPAPRDRGRAPGRVRAPAPGDRAWMGVSAVRGWFFNAVLAMRLAVPDWASLGAGDVAVEAPGPDGVPRAVPSGPLWGRGRSAAEGLQGALEARVPGTWPRLTEWLEHAGLRQDRRPMVLFPAALAWRSVGAGAFEFSFELPPGAFATTVLRELFTVHDAGARSARRSGRPVRHAQ